MKSGSWSLLVVSKVNGVVDIGARVVAALALLTLPLSVQAANRFWDGAITGGTGDGASAGGTATWDISTLNWDQGNALSRVAWINGNNDTAIFGGTAGTVSLGTGITVGGLQFDTAAYLIQSNTLTFGTAGSIVVNENATISSVIAGSVAITKTGTATLTLSGTNTYTGATIISDGTLQAGSAGAFNNTSSLLMTNGSGTLDLNGNNIKFTASTLSSATATIIDNAGGSGTSTAALGTVGAGFAVSSSLIKDGPTRKVAVTLRNNNGGARFSNGGNNFSGGLTLLDSPDIGWGTRLLPGTIVAGAYGTGPIIIGQSATDKAGIFFQVNNLPFANDIVFNTALGTDLKGIRFDSSGHVLSGTITANLAPITFSAFSDGGATLSGKLTGSEGLSLASDHGNITITLNNAAVNNDYQGSTAINGKGILALGASNQIPNGASAGNVTNNGTLRLNGFSDTINGLSGTGIVDGVNGTPTLTFGDNDATSTFSGVIRNTADTLAVTKIGGGTITLSGFNTYKGATTVSAGKLVGVSGGSIQSSAVTVASGSALGVRVASDGGQWGLGALTLNSGSTTAEFDFAVAPSTITAPMFVNGDLINNGTLGISVISDSLISGATYPLIQYSGSLTIGALMTNLPVGVSGTLVNNIANKTIDLNVTTGNGLVWSAGTGVWDINTSSNWNNQTATYTDGSSPLFNDTPAGAGPFTVTLNTNVNPGSVIVNNDVKAYTIGGSGAMAGAAELIKSGVAALTLAVTNSYSGATSVRAGTLKAGSTGGLSSNSALSVSSGATVDLSGFNNTIVRLSTNDNPGTITDSSAPGSGGILRIATSMPGTLNSNVFTGSLGLQLFGGNTVNTLLSTTTNTYSGGTIFGNGTGSTSTRVLLGGGTLGAGAPGAITSGLFGTGPITMGVSTTDQVQLYFGSALTVNYDIVVNSARGTDVPGTFRAESAGVVFAGAINANLADATFSAQNSGGRTISVTGPISGNAGVSVFATNAGGLVVTLTSAANTNSYAGNTMVISTNATLTLGAVNQIPNGTGKGNLIVTRGAFNLGGFSETINGLSGTGTVDGVSGTPILTAGDNNATSTFAGVIKNTAGTLALTKIGTGTLTLSGANSYDGATIISNGTLALSAPGSIGNSPLISVAAGGTFDAGPGFTLGVGQTLAGTGTVISDVAVDGAVSPGIGGIGTLTASNNITWNAGVAWPYDLGAASTSDRLSINGDFTMGAGGEAEFVFDLQNAGVAGVYTLVTWTASTTFADGSEFSAINIPGGLTPSFAVGANELVLILTGAGGGDPIISGSTNTSISVVGGNVQFGFNIASGAVYHVQASTNLLALIDNGFTNVTSQLTNFGASTIIYTNTSSLPVQMFRIKSP
jgi:autotransporter-associated beta strand protein